MTATNGVLFLFPTQGVTLHYNDYVEVQYESNFTDPWLYTFCKTSTDSISEKGSEEVGGYNNTATIKLDWSGSDTPCWFDLKPNSSAPSGSGANSESWSFDVSQRAATTVGLEASTTSSTSTATASGDASGSSTSSSPSSTSTSSSSGQSSGLSTGAQAGIGVGVAIAGIAIGAAAVVMFMRHRRRQRADREAAAARIEAHPAGGSSSGADEMKYPAQSVQQRVSPLSEVEGGYPMPQELHGASTSQYHELPSHAD